jgi:hypothetical protein
MCRKAGTAAATDGPVGDGPAEGVVEAPGVVDAVGVLEAPGAGEAPGVADAVGVLEAPGAAAPADGSGEIVVAGVAPAVGRTAVVVAVASGLAEPGPIPHPITSTLPIARARAARARRRMIIGSSDRAWGDGLQRIPDPRIRL